MEQPFLVLTAKPLSHFSNPLQGILPPGKQTGADYCRWVAACPQVGVAEGTAGPALLPGEKGGREDHSRNAGRNSAHSPTVRACRTALHASKSHWRLSQQWNIFEMILFLKYIKDQIKILITVCVYRLACSQPIPLLMTAAFYHLSSKEWSLWRAS